MSRDKARRRRIPLGRIVLLCMLLPGLYVAFQLYHITQDTYTYETAIQYTMSDSIQADGVVLFDEIPVEGSGDLGYLVADGERVSAGTQVAEVYTDAGQAAVRSQLNTLNTQISLLQKSQNTSSAQVDVLIAQRSTAIYDLLEDIDHGRASALAQTREDYLLAQNKLQITTGQASNFSAQIDDLTAQRDGLAGQLASLQSIAAPAGGYFVSADSAKKLSAAPADILAMPAGQLGDFLKDGASSAMDGLAGKIVPSYTWQFCGVCSAEDAAKFAGVKKVTISFPGKAETRLPATVVSVEHDEDGANAKFVLQCQYISADILRLTQETAQVDFKNYSGLRVSTDAIHFVREDQLTPLSAAQNSSQSASSAASSAAPLLSASSEANAAESTSEAASSGAASSEAGQGDYVAGVYVKYGNLARFRRIQTLYQDPKGEYILIAPNGALGTTNEVRLYDEVIISGTNLYDGKLL
jgi:hypothetical protein